ncbi:MAG TPA: two-component regulator propeller domain-containing protein, partial [Pirellula sp.]|nr:two-component regulator propeller domain-containing protein [Pirellula sp.]
MEEDLEGSFWIGTDRGLFQLRTPQARVFTTRDGLLHDNVHSVCETSDGTIWCDTDKGLSRIQNDRVVKFERGELWSRNRAMCAGKNGKLWVANRDQGVREIDNDQFFTPIGEQAISEVANLLYEDKSGRLWIGTSSDIAVWENGKKISGEELTGRSIAEVHSILETRDKTFWFGSKAMGLVRWCDGKKTVFTERDGLSNQQIWAMHEDGSGALWLGSDNGLTRFKNGNFFAFQRPQGLREETINCILEDDFGFLWLSGLQGIYR